MDNELGIRLAAMEIPEGALIVASIDESVSYERAQQMLNQIGRARDALGKSNPVLLLVNGVRLESLNEEQLAHIGLMRIPGDGQS